MARSSLFFSLLAVLACFALLATSKPLPRTTEFAEIERRWIEGESEASIHAHYHQLHATPAWMLGEPHISFHSHSRSKRDAFATTTDSTTQARREEKNDHALRMHMARSVRKALGIKNFLGRNNAEDMMERELLRPVKGSVRYRWLDARRE